MLRSLLAKGLLAEAAAPRGALAQKERGLISARTRAALAAARAWGAVLDGDRGYRPAAGPDAAAATQARRAAAERAAHLLALEVERLRAKGVAGHAELPRTMTDRGVPTPGGAVAWTHTTVAGVLRRVANVASHAEACQSVSYLDRQVRFVCSIGEPPARPSPTSLISARRLAVP